MQTRKRQFEDRMTPARIGVFLVGLIIMALGIDLNTKTLLGISPINSVPYNIHQLFGLPLWISIYLVYILFIFLQWALLRDKFRPIQFLQIGTSLLNSLFVQFFDDRLPVMKTMPSRLGVLALAIVLTAAGISLTAGMKFVPNPGEGIAGALGVFLKKDFGFGKNVLDIACVLISVVLSLIFAGRVMNIGIGTVLSMLLTGRVVKLLARPTAKLYARVAK